MNLSLNKAEEIIVTHMSASSKILQQTNIRVPSFEVEYKHTTYYATGFWKQFHVLLRRNAIKLLRDKVISLHILSSHFPFFRRCHDKNFFFLVFFFFLYIRVDIDPHTDIDAPLYRVDRRCDIFQDRTRRHLRLR